MEEDSSRDKFLQCATRPDGDVAAGALWLARDDFGKLDLEPFFAILDEAAAHLRDAKEHAQKYSIPLEQDRADCLLIRKTMQEVFQLRGSGGADPRAHYLHTAIDRKLGVPIICSTLWISVARRGGIAIDGISVPGHFLVRIGELYVDPFLGGDEVDENEMLDRMVARFGVHRDIVRSHVFSPATNKDMLARMTRNLRGCYAVRQQWDLALRSADRSVLLLPDDPRERRDRGIVRWQSGQIEAAIDDLTYYCEQSRRATDLDRVAAIIRHIQGSAH